MMHDQGILQPREKLKNEKEEKLKEYNAEIDYANHKMVLVEQTIQTSKKDELAYEAVEKQQNVDSLIVKEKNLIKKKSEF